MQPEFLERLPEGLKQFVLETEGSIGFDVEIVSRPPDGPAAGGVRAPMACEIDLDFARILLPVLDQFRPNSVLH